MNLNIIKSLKQKTLTRVSQDWETLVKALESQTKSIQNAVKILKEVEVSKELLQNRKIVALKEGTLVLISIGKLILGSLDVLALCDA